MAKKRHKTVVRGADGTLYLLTKTGRPVKLTDRQAREVHQIVEELEGRLEAIVADELKNIALSCTQHIRILIPDVNLE